MLWRDVPLVLTVPTILGDPVNVDLSRTRLYEALKSGELVSRDLGGKYLIARESLMAWLGLDPAVVLIRDGETAPSTKLRAVSQDLHDIDQDSDIPAMVS